ncbi:MAG: THUMP domain-containing protein, partial [Archaeoglobaceae archaeon]
SVDGRILTINFDGNEFFDRLAFSHEVIELMSICKPEKLEMEFSKIEVDGTFCVRVTGVGIKSDNSLERRLGEILWKKGNSVNLKNPEVVVRVYITRENCYIGFLKFKQNKKQFLDRKPNLRPFFMPVVILPKFAKALVNLTSVRKGKIL